MSRVNDNGILPEDKDVTQKILTDIDFSSSMEKDIEKVEDELDERQIDFEEFERFIQQRLSTLSSWNSRADTTAEELVDGDASFEDAFEIIDVPRDKERKAISHGESADVKQVLSNSQVLIGQLAVMLKICVDSLEYAEEAVDIQKSQRVQKETIKILRDNMGDIMANTARESVRGVVTEAVDEVRSTERLKSEIADIKSQMDESEASEIDVDQIVEDVKADIDSGSSSSVNRDIDLARVLENSNIERKKDLGILFKEHSELKNEQIAGILDTSQSAVNNW